MLNLLNETTILQFNVSLQKRKNKKTTTNNYDYAKEININAYYFSWFYL